MRLVIAIATLASAISIAHANDGVYDMCLELDDEDICSCASEALRSEIEDQDYAIYEAIGAVYIKRRAAGETRVEAWTAASAAVASDIGISGSDLTKRTNVIGRAQRDAIKSCAAG